MTEDLQSIQDDIPDNIVNADEMIIGVRATKEGHAIGIVGIIETEEMGKVAIASMMKADKAREVAFKLIQYADDIEKGRVPAWGE